MVLKKLNKIGSEVGFEPRTSKTASGRATNSTNAAYMFLLHIYVELDMQRSK
jgi:hypothetical protein